MHGSPNVIFMFTFSIRIHFINIFVSPHNIQLIKLKLFMVIVNEEYHTETCDIQEHWFNWIFWHNTFNAKNLYALFLILLYFTHNKCLFITWPFAGNLITSKSSTKFSLHLWITMLFSGHNRTKKNKMDNNTEWGCGDEREKKVCHYHKYFCWAALKAYSLIQRFLHGLRLLVSFVFHSLAAVNHFGCLHCVRTREKKKVWL